MTKIANMSTKDVATAIRNAHGFISPAADSLNVGRATLYRRIGKSETLKKVIQECRDINLDRAELRLLEAIDKRSPWAVCFYLKTQGKARGYIERQEVKHEGEIKGSGGPVRIYIPDNGRTVRDGASIRKPA